MKSGSTANRSSAPAKSSVPTKSSTPARSPESVDPPAGSVEWVKKHAVKFKSVDPSDTDFSDLQPLKELIGDAQIVQLGEQSHGDGKCFETKTRLIKFLHQEMGFDVLAFESGIYDCDRAWQDFQLQAKSDQQKANSGFESARLGVFGIWTGSRQTQNLWQYLASSAKTDKPLELCGYDCQFTGGASSKFLVKDIQKLVQDLELEIEPKNLRALTKGVMDLASFRKASVDETKFFAALESVIKATAIRMKKPADGKADDSSSRFEYWNQVLVSIKELAKYRWSTDEAKAGVAFRDAQMAKNLLWLHQKKYPGRKIIVWAASFHIARNLAEVEVLRGPNEYGKMVPMGHHVHQALGEKVFTVGFTASEGSAGPWMRGKFPIQMSMGGSLEDICEQAELENGWVQLKTDDPTSWQNQPMLSRPLGYGWMKGKWNDHFDAMIYNREMTPSTGR